MVKHLQCDDDYNIDACLHYRSKKILPARVCLDIQEAKQMNIDGLIYDQLLLNGTQVEEWDEDEEWETVEGNEDCKGSQYNQNTNTSINEQLGHTQNGQSQVYYKH